MNMGQAWTAIFHGKGNEAVQFTTPQHQFPQMDSVAGRLEWEEAGKMVTLKVREVREKTWVLW